MTTDQHTADTFATSWNNLPAGSVCTREQYADWLAPPTEAAIGGHVVLELAFGNGCCCCTPQRGSHRARWTSIQGHHIHHSALRPFLEVRWTDKNPTSSNHHLSLTSRTMDDNR